MDDCEDIWLQLTEKNKCDRPLVIGADYRHPRNDETKFTKIFNEKILELNQKIFSFISLVTSIST